MDYSSYHPDWKDVIRPQILKRDGYKCTYCGIRNKVEVYRQSNGMYQEVDDFVKEWCKVNKKKVFKVYLQVAHRDHDKTNNDPSNLFTLCPKHHSQLDSDHKKMTRKSFAKMVESTKSQKPIDFEQSRKKKISEIRSAIHSITGVYIEPHQASQLCTIISKHY